MKTVIIHGETWKFDDVKDEIDLVKKSNWTKAKWTTTKALVEKNGGSVRPYTGQTYDPKYFELSDNAWTHDHCIICWHRIDDENPREENYTNGQNWICAECHDQFLTK